MANIHEITESLEDQTEKLHHRVEEMREKVKQHVGEARDRLEEMADKVQDRSEEAWDDAVSIVKKHPIESVVVSLLIGAAIGAFLSRHPRD